MDYNAKTSDLLQLIRSSYHYLNLCNGKPPSEIRKVVANSQWLQNYLNEDMTGIDWLWLSIQLKGETMKRETKTEMVIRQVKSNEALCDACRGQTESFIAYTLQMSVYIRRLCGFDLSDIDWAIVAKEINS